MSAEQPPGLTILGRCTNGLRLVSDQAKPGDWESLPRREPKRLRGLAPWRSKLIEAKPVEPPTR